TITGCWTTTGAGCTITGAGATATGRPTPIETRTPPAWTGNGRERLAIPTNVITPNVRTRVLIYGIMLSSSWQMDAALIDATMQQTAITGVCLHGTAGYQHSARRHRYPTQYLIGRSCKDHKRRCGTQDNRAR